MVFIGINSHNRTDHPEDSYGGWSSVPADVETVPTLLKDTDLAALKLKPYKNLIGYNEPDNDNVVLHVDMVIKKWPEVVATGKRIGSPAPAVTHQTGNTWFEKFMHGIDKIGSHVDFICLHYYSPDGNVTRFRDWIELVHETYHKPIWVTEWSYIDYTTPPYTPIVPSVQEQVRYMREAAAMLQKLKFVERHSWAGSPDGKANLFDRSGNITPMGKAYQALR